MLDSTSYPFHPMGESSLQIYHEPFCLISPSPMQFARNSAPMYLSKIAQFRYYNAPNSDRLAAYYKDLPEKLEKEGIDPRVPWLYNYKLDFRFC